MSQPAPTLCTCGHTLELHDPLGCASFVGGYPETSHIRRYCSCTGYAGSAGADEEDPDDEDAA